VGVFLFAVQAERVRADFAHWDAAVCRAGKLKSGTMRRRSAAGVWLSYRPIGCVRAGRRNRSHPVRPALGRSSRSCITEEARPISEAPPERPPGSPAAGKVRQAATPGPTACRRTGIMEH
jgi:hypothetical protein